MTAEQPGPGRFFDFINDPRISLPDNTLPEASVGLAVGWFAGLSEEVRLQDPDLHWQTAQMVARLCKYDTRRVDQMILLYRKLNRMQLFFGNPELAEESSPALSEELALDLACLALGDVREELERRRLGNLAYHDPLTGAQNRNGITRLIDAWTKPEKQHRRTAEQDAENRAKLSIDLTNFKQINDVIAYEIGDAALVEAVLEMRDLTRKEDNPQIGRPGGDEFDIYIDSIPFAGYQSLMRRCYDTQFEKVVSKRYLEAWVKIHLMRHACRKVGAPFVPEVLLRNPEDPRSARILNVNGKELCELRDIVVLSIGGEHGRVTNEEEYRKLSASALNVRGQHKDRLHKRMGGAYRMSDLAVFGLENFPA